jgi:hypothetical protein
MLIEIEAFRIIVSLHSQVFPLQHHNLPIVVPGPR